MQPAAHTLLRPSTRLAIALAVGVALSTPAAAQLLVVSQNNAKVLEYDEGDGSFVGTFVEAVEDGFQNPGGVAIHPGSGALYVTSTGSNEIWEYDVGTGDAVTSATTVVLIQPAAAAFDASGSTLYFVAADNDLSITNDAVKALTISSGNISPVTTDPSANFSALVVDGSQLFVTDSLNGSVVRVPLAGGSDTTVITGLVSPGGVLLSTATEMLIAETNSDRVVEYDLIAGTWVFDRVVLPASAGVDGPSGLALAPDGRLTVVGSLSNEAVAVHLGTLAVSALVTSGSGGLTGAGGAAWGGSTLHLASRSTNTVIQYDATGAPTGTVARGLSTPADAGMAFAPGGNLVVASRLDNDLVEYDGQGGALVRSFFDACPTSLAEPFDVSFGADGHVYVSCPASSGVHRFDGVTGLPLGFFVSGGSGGLTNPRGLAFGPNGNLFVAGGSGSWEVFEYDGTTGVFIGVFVDATGNGGGAMDPYGLLFHGDSLFVASYFPDEVKQFDAATGAFVQTFVTSGAGGLSGPTNLAFGPDGDLYVTSFDDDAVRRYDGGDGSFVEVFVASGSGGLSGPVDLEFAPEPTATAALASGALLLWGLCERRRAARRSQSSSASRGSSR
jgi:sugar lactone lactonase YvrE